METIEQLPLTSLPLSAHQQEKLKALFPEVFTEGGKIDFDKLKLTLGEAVDVGKERYGMNWPGKADCFKAIQQPSRATLVPDREGSVNFDTSENLFVEGDNLEVLKLLQKSYLGKVKMIYIDPPYNTGNEFIYPDNYAESLDTYLEYTGQVDGEGRRFATNTETDGRFHSKWLNMMYPRLFLARNLLREDGVIFISIDDNEVTNLRSICDEIFSSDCFCGAIVINSTPNARNYGHIAKMHEYCLMYAKSADEAITFELEEAEKEFRYNDQKGGFNIHPLYNSDESFHAQNRKNLFYPFYIDPSSKDVNGFYQISTEKTGKYQIEVYPPLSTKNKVQFVWRWGKEKAKENLNTEIVGYITEEGEYRIVRKMRHTSKLARSIFFDSAFSGRKGTAEVEYLFKNKLFSFPKPVHLVKTLLQIGSDKSDIILDFFAGSATTAHAVLELNKEDGGNRKVICVQLPEPTDEKSEAFKAGYKTIAEISKERIRRVIKKLAEAPKTADLFVAEKAQNLGFKSFRLAPSNFKVWDGTVAKTPEAIQTQLYSHIDHIVPEAGQEAILYELLLKAGFPLATPIEILTLEGKTVYSVSDGALLICLEKALTPELLKSMADSSPQRVICLDEGFGNNDQLKTNALQLMKSRKVSIFQTV